MFSLSAAFSSRKCGRILMHPNDHIFFFHQNYLKLLYRSPAVSSSLGIPQEGNREHWNSVLLLCCTEDWVPHCIPLERSHIMWPKQQNQSSDTAAIVLLTPQFSAMTHFQCGTVPESKPDVRGKETSHSSIHLQLRPWRRALFMFKISWGKDWARDKGRHRWASKPLVRRCSKLAASLMCEGSNHVSKSKEWSPRSPRAMLTCSTWVCHCSCSLCQHWPPLLLSSHSKRTEIASCSCCDFKKFAAKVVAEHCGQAWTGGAVKWGQSLEVLLKIFFEKLPYSPSFLYF